MGIDQGLANVGTDQIGVGTDQGLHVKVGTDQGYHGYRSGSGYRSGAEYRSESYIRIYDRYGQNICPSSRCM